MFVLFKSVYEAGTYEPKANYDPEMERYVARRQAVLKRLAQKRKTKIPNQEEVIEVKAKKEPVRKQAIKVKKIVKKVKKDNRTIFIENFSVDEPEPSGDFKLYWKWVNKIVKQNKNKTDKLKEKHLIKLDKTTRKRLTTAKMDRILQKKKNKFMRTVFPEEENEDRDMREVLQWRYQYILDVFAHNRKPGRGNATRLCPFLYTNFKDFVRKNYPEMANPKSFEDCVGNGQSTPINLDSNMEDVSNNVKEKVLDDNVNVKLDLEQENYKEKTNKNVDLYSMDVDSFFEECEFSSDSLYLNSLDVSLLDHEMDDISVNNDKGSVEQASNTQINVGLESIVAPSSEKHVDDVNDFRFYDYLNRWNQVDSFDWTSTALHNSKPIYKMNIFMDLLAKLSSTTAIIPLKNCQFFRADVELLFMINTNQFTSGQLQIAIVYGADYTQASSDSMTSVYTLSHKDHALINAGGEQEVKLTIPYKFPMSMINCSPLVDFGACSMAHIIVSVLSPLTSKATEVFSTQVVISAKLTNVKIAGMVDASIKPVKGSEVDHEMMPAAINIASKLLSPSNCDMPPARPERTIVTPLATSNMSVGTNSVYSNEIMRIDPDSATPHPYAIDDFNISKIIRTYGLISRVQLSTTTQVGKVLKKYEVSPLTSKTSYTKVASLSDKKSFECFALPPIAVMSSMFGYYRGSIEYRFDVICTAFHACKMMVVYIPGPVNSNYSTWTIKQFRNCHHQIFDILKEKQFKFVVPYINGQVFYPRRTLTDIGMNSFEPFGHLYLVPMSNLYTTDLISKTIDILVYVRAGEDFEFSIPAQTSIMPSYDRTDAHKARYLSINFLEGYYPAYQGTWHTFSNTTAYYPILRYGEVSDHVAQISHAHKYSVYSLDYGQYDQIDSWTMLSPAPGNPNLSLYIKFICPIFDGSYFYAVPFTTLQLAGEFALASAKYKAWGDMIKYVKAYTTVERAPTYTNTNNSPAYDAKIGNLQFNFVAAYPETKVDSDFELIHEAGDQTLDNTIPSSIPNLVNSMSRLHFGENTMDIKNICRRMHLYCSVKISQNMPFLSTSCTIPITPWGITLDQMSSDVTPVRTNIALIASAYLFAKGTLRFKIVAEGNCKFWVQHRYDAFNTDEMATVYSDPNTSNIGFASGYSICMQDSNVNPMLDLEVPYYSPCNRIYANPTKSNISSSFYLKQMFNLGSLMIGCSAPSNFTVFYSIGDDFQFSDFIGFPPVFFSVDSMTTEPVAFEHEMDIFRKKKEKKQAVDTTLQAEPLVIREDPTPSTSGTTTQSLTVIDDKGVKKKEVYKTKLANILMPGVGKNVERMTDAAVSTQKSVSDTLIKVDEELVPKMSKVCDTVNNFIEKLDVGSAVKKFFSSTKHFLHNIMTNIAHLSITRNIKHFAVAITSILTSLGGFTWATIKMICKYSKDIIKMAWFQFKNNNGKKSDGKSVFVYLRSEHKKFYDDNVNALSDYLGFSLDEGMLRLAISKLSLADLKKKRTPEELIRKLIRTSTDWVTLLYTGSPLEHIFRLTPEFRSSYSNKLVMDLEQILHNRFIDVAMTPIADTHKKRLLSQFRDKVSPHFPQMLITFNQWFRDHPNSELCPQCLSYTHTYLIKMNHEAPPEENSNMSLFVDLVSIITSAVSTMADVKDTSTDKTKFEIAKNFFKKMPSYARGGLNISIFLKTLWSTIEKCFYLVKNKLCPAERLTCELAEKYADVREWIDEVLFLTHPDRWDKLISNTVLQTRLETAVGMGTNLLCILELSKKYATDYRFMHVINTHYKSLIDLRKKCHENKISLNNSYEPYMMYFWGEPGVGKSYIKDAVVKTITEVCKIKTEGDLIFNIPANAPFWDKCSNQPFCYSDDFNLTTDQNLGLTMYANICALKSPNSFIPNKAALEDKGKNYSPEFLYICSNFERPTIEGVANVVAFLRRPEMFVQMAMRDDLLKKGYTKFADLPSRLRGRKGMFDHLKFGVCKREGTISAGIPFEYEWYDYTNFMTLLLSDIVRYRIEEQVKCENRFKVVLSGQSDDECLARAKKFLRPELRDLTYSAVKKVIELESLSETSQESNIIESSINLISSLGDTGADEDGSSAINDVIRYGKEEPLGFVYDPNRVIETLDQASLTCKRIGENIENFGKIDSVDMIDLKPERVSDDVNQMSVENFDMVDSIEMLVLRPERVGEDVNKIDDKMPVRVTVREYDDSCGPTIVREKERKYGPALEEGKLSRDVKVIDGVNVYTGETLEIVGGQFFGADHEIYLENSDLASVLVDDNNKVPEIPFTDFSTYVEKLSTMPIDRKLRIFHITDKFIYFEDHQKPTRFVIKVAKVDWPSPKNKTWGTLYDMVAGSAIEFINKGFKLNSTLQYHHEAYTNNHSDLRKLFESYIESAKAGIKSFWETSKSVFAKTYKFISRYRWVFALSSIVLAGVGLISWSCLGIADSFAVGIGAGGITGRCARRLPLVDEEVEKTPVIETIVERADKVSTTDMYVPSLVDEPVVKSYVLSHETDKIGDNRRFFRTKKEQRNYRRAMNAQKLQHQMPTSMREDLLERIERNTYWLTLLNGDGLAILPPSRIFFLYDRCAIMPLHYIECFRMKYNESGNDNFKLALTKGETFRLDFSFSLLKGVRPMKSSSIVMLDFPKSFPCVRDTTSMLFNGDKGCLTTQDSFLVVTDPKKTCLYATPFTVQTVHIPHTSRGSEVNVNQGYVYRVQSPGFCGSMFVIDNKIVGMHVAGGGGRGVAEPLGDFVYAHEIILPSDMKGIECPLKKEVKNYHHLGVVPNCMASYNPDETNYILSDIHPYFPRELHPSTLKVFNYMGKTISPLYSGIEEHFHPVENFPREKLEVAAKDYGSMLLRNCKPVRNFVSVLTYEQSIFGMKENPAYKSIDKSTSAGWPYNKGYIDGLTTKRQLLGESMDEVNNEFLEECRERDLGRRNGFMQDTVFEDKLKDDLVPERKINVPGGTRIISCSPLEYTVNCRRYFLDFVNAMSAGNIKTECAVGMNVLGTDWSDMVCHMLDFSDSFVDGDYKKFGPRLNADVLYECIAIINSWYDMYDVSNHKIDNKVRRVMIEELINSIHLAGNVLYKTFCGAPSGSPLTAILNSMVNCMYIRLIWLELGLPIEDFVKYVRLLVYGDDIIIAIKRNILNVFNYFVLRDMFAKYNIVFTPADKVGEVKPYSTIWDISFLKSTMYNNPINGGKFVYKIELSSIYKMLIYQQKSHYSTQTEQLLCQINSAMLYAIGHGEEVYNKLADRINTALLKECSISMLVTQHSKAMLCLLNNEIVEDDYKLVRFVK